MVFCFMDVGRMLFIQEHSNLNNFIERNMQSSTGLLTKDETVKTIVRKINQSFLAFIVPCSCNYVCFSVELSQRTIFTLQIVIFKEFKVVILCGYRVTLYFFMNINFINLFFSFFSNLIIFYKTLYFANRKVHWYIDQYLIRLFLYGGKR